MSALSDAADDDDKDHEGQARETGDENIEQIAWNRLAQCGLFIDTIAIRTDAIHKLSLSEQSHVRISAGVYTTTILVTEASAARTAKGIAGIDTFTSYETFI